MCPVCKENNFNIIGLPAIGAKEAKIINQDYRVVQCNKCFIYYINPGINFNKEEWEYLYGDDYFPPLTKWHKKRREKDRNYRLNTIEKYSKGSIKNFLDIGCGEGFCLIEAESRGWNAYGIDITDNRIPLAKKESIKFINSDLINAHLPDNFFDAVYVDSVLEHVINPYEYLIEIKRILKKGGILYFAVPNEDSLLNDIKNAVYKLSGKDKSARLKPFKTPYHIIGYNKHSIKLILQKLDLKICRLRNFSARLEFLKARFLSREYLLLLSILPINILSFLVRKEVYLETFVKKD